MDVGGGIAWAFSNNWSVKIEYQYFDFGGRDVFFTPSAAQPALEHLDQRIQTVKLGVNYRFWTGGAPTAGRY